LCRADVGLRAANAEPIGDEQDAARQRHRDIGPY
jgi:hypothetical protein